MIFDVVFGYFVDLFEVVFDCCGCDLFGVGVVGGLGFVLYMFGVWFEVGVEVVVC